MTSQGRKRDKNQINIYVSPRTSAPANIRSHTHTHTQSHISIIMKWFKNCTDQNIQLCIFAQLLIQ
jgi:hypothetical protein